jgi:hypothetical protein
MEEMIVQFTTPHAMTEEQKELARRYWAHTLVKGKRIYTESTKDITAEFGIQTSGGFTFQNMSARDLLNVVEATVTFECASSNCGNHATVEGLSRTSLAAFCGYSTSICKECAAKRNVESDAALQAERERLEATAIIEEEAKRRRQAAAIAEREEKKAAAVKKYGELLLDECPECCEGFRIIRINGSSLQVFLTCSTTSVWSKRKQCEYKENLIGAELVECKRRFMAELTKRWTAESQAFGEAAQ